MNDSHCFYCNQPATKLCDGRTATGTCDRPMCQNCVAHQGMFIACARSGRNKKARSFSDTVDYCRNCAARRGINTSNEAAVAKAEKATAQIKPGDRVIVWQQVPPFTPAMSPAEIGKLAQKPWSLPIDPNRPKFRCWGEMPIVVLRRQRKNSEVWLTVTSSEFPEPLRSQGVRVPLSCVELAEAGYGLPRVASAPIATPEKPIQVKQEVLF